MADITNLWAQAKLRGLLLRSAANLRLDKEGAPARGSIGVRPATPPRKGQPMNSLEAHALEDCTIEIVTLNGPMGQTMPALRMTVISSSREGAETHWPPLVLPLGRAQKLSGLLSLAVADLQALLHQRPDSVQ